MPSFPKCDPLLALQRANHKMESRPDFSYAERKDGFIEMGCQKQPIFLCPMTVKTEESRFCCGASGA